MADKTLLKQAEAHLKKNKNDSAINLLRANNAPNDKDRCRLLALAYYQRGDSKGDVYSSHFFAERAIALGEDTQQMHAIKAVGALRKHRYDESVAEFASFVDAAAEPAQQFLYAIALGRTGRHDDAEAWVQKAQTAEPDNPVYQQGLDVLDQPPKGAHEPTFGNIYDSVIESLKASDASDIDSPYKYSAVSKLRGHGNAPRDFEWLDRNIPCQSACPAGTDIPEYLTAIYDGEYDRAYKINLQDNVFPGVLGRVCARPCEAECRHGWEGLGESVAICWSKRSAADLKEAEPVVLDKVSEATGKKVAVIGGGVAGLAAARQLTLLGHEVQIYEKHKSPGGMLNQGIPIFRLPREIIDREVKQVEATGVTITCNTEIGKDIKLTELTDKFDAIVMAAGTLRPNLLNLPGKELDGIHHGLEFLLDVNEGDGFDIGKRVIVIGGGFTAMDCARTAWRLDTDDVRVLYRRSQKEMLITPGELEELEHEGIPMEFMASPVAYIGNDDGKVVAIRFIRNELGEPGADGRRRPVPIQGSEFELPVDTVLLATGQFPDTSWIDGAIRKELVGDDEWLLDFGKHKTACDKIFVAGDFSTGARSLIDAIGHAKQTVLDVDTFLMDEKRVVRVAEVSDVQETGRIREMDYVPVQTMPTIPVADRDLEAEVETGYDPELAVDETQRCYRCHFKYEIDYDKCIFCDWCIKAKPRPNCIVKVKDFKYAKDGRMIAWEEAKETDEKSFIYINQEDCIRCNACVDACPVDCISIQKVSSKTLCDVSTLRDRIQATADADGKYRYLGS